VTQIVFDKTNDAIRAYAEQIVLFYEQFLVDCLWKEGKFAIEFCCRGEDFHDLFSLLVINPSSYEKQFHYP